MCLHSLLNARRCRLTLASSLPHLPHSGPQLSKQLEDLRANRRNTEKMLQQVGSPLAMACLPHPQTLHLHPDGPHQQCRLPRSLVTPPPPARPAQVVRQRDTLRQLLQSSGNDLDAARQAYAASLGGAASPGGPAGASTPAPGSATPGAGAAAGTPSQAGPDYRAMHADLDSQFKEYKEEAAKTQEMLSKDVRWGRVCCLFCGGLCSGRSGGPSGPCCWQAGAQVQPTADVCLPGWLLLMV